MASITDKFSQVSTSNTARPVVALLDAPGKALAASSINLTAATNWPALVHFVIYNKTADGRKDITSQTDWKGTLSGTTISNLTPTGGTDVEYTAGAIVELTPTYRYAKDLYDGLAVVHEDTGALKSNTVDSSQIVASAVGASELAAGAVDATKLSTDAITLGYTQITTNFTSASTTPVQVTGLTASVTIPAGARGVRISFFSWNVATSSAGSGVTMSIWDGVVGVGTNIGLGSVTSPASNNGYTGIASAIVTPAAGAKTYNIGVATGAGTLTVNASASSPAYILVEAI